MRYKTIAGLLILAVILAWHPAFAQKAKTAKAPVPQAAQEKQPAFDPQAREILLKMCEFMKAQQQFTFKAEVTDDHLTENGEVVQVSFDLEAYMRRPDRLRIDGVGDLMGKQFYYDGKTITLYDKTHNVYATEEAPPEIEAALDKAHREYNLRIALADLAGASLCDHMSKGITHGIYAGMHKVRGVLCHHFTFDRKDAHVQVWVQDGDQPLIRKVVITREGLPHSPQWSAVLTDWNLDPRLDDNVFVYVPPEGAEKIEFVRPQTAQASKPTPQRPKNKGGKQ